MESYIFYTPFLYVFFYSMNCTFKLEYLDMMISSEIYRLLELFLQKTSRRKTHQTYNY